ncbi:hypothetical protein MPH_09694 [Macrophomina phaseolina MS6]|uniref:Uncharacterized protein n=1 Tax=Macrophomina phaseolina (strain MS6) TaxID=1126212 RepID=K2RSB5_MACPH|nr:hypothetical protein MPH_09694 [Macrophomina phaseolina MS6]
MGRSSKFAFPLPGRRHHGEQDHHQDPLPRPDHDALQPSKAERLLGTGLPGRRTPSQHSANSFSRNNSATPSLETKRSYMSITLSEASQESRSLRKGSPAADESLLVPPQPRFHQDRSSSRTKDRSASITSSTYSRNLGSQASSSTLRSHYDSQRQPLHVSQQTSMSAVRDGGLRKGHPSVYSSSRSTDQDSMHSSVPSVEPDTASISSGKAVNRKKKVPARLDLSKLFPKAPKSREPHDQQLLSPTKFVSSPVPMSTTSTHFPRPLTSPTASASNRNRAISVTSTKTSDTLREGRAQAAKERAYNTPFDNAKVNRRRPPPGIQHWFEGLSDDDEDEEDVEEETAPTPANVKAQDSRSLPLRQQPPHDYRREAPPPRHGRKTSYTKMVSADRSHRYHADQFYPSERSYPREAKTAPEDYHYRADLSQASRITRSSDRPHLRGQPSQTSLTSHDTRTSAWTKASKISNRDLKGDSVLSLSSSEDEADPRSSGTSLPVIRDSLAMSTDTEGEILIGRAQAFDIRPRHDHNSRRMTAASGMTSASGASVWSSTTGATIDIMLSPTTAASSQTNLLLPRYSNSRSGRRSQHSRQVSAIPEDDTRSYAETFSITSYEDKETSSIKSGRTSKSEPRSHMGHKLMAVTEEEEVLLELMRRKRAAMAKQSFTDGYRSAMRLEQARAETPGLPPDHQQRFTEYAATESSSSECPRKQALAERERRPSKKSLLSQTTAAETETSSSTGETLINATYVPSSRSEKRSRPPPTANEALLRSPGSSSMASSSSVFSLPRSRTGQRITSQPPQISPAIFSPLEVFASPPDSPTFPATASHTDTIPSPITPGPGSDGEPPVKVVGSSIGGSEASFGTDHESIHPTQHHHHHHPSDVSVGHKGRGKPSGANETVSATHARIDDGGETKGTDRSRSHSRRRTASSGANVDICADTPGQAVTSDVVVPPRTSSQMAFPNTGVLGKPDPTASRSSVTLTKNRPRPTPAEWDWENEVDLACFCFVKYTKLAHHRRSEYSKGPIEQTEQCYKPCQQQEWCKE